jgi:ABC-type Na+ transport system ATPase subunit NatA
MDLDLMEQTKICKEAIHVIHPDKFKLIDKLAGLEQLLFINNLVQLEELIDKLHEFMGLHGMYNMFYVLEFDSLDQAYLPRLSYYYDDQSPTNG